MNCAVQKVKHEVSVEAEMRAVEWVRSFVGHHGHYDMAEDMRRLSIRILDLEKCLTYDTKNWPEQLRDLRFAVAESVAIAEHHDVVRRKAVEAFAALFARSDPERSRHGPHRLGDPRVRVVVWRMTGGRCTYCDGLLSHPVSGGDGSVMCIEHVVPSSRGGPDVIANYVPACQVCNASKGDRHVLEHIRRVQKTAAVPSVGGQDV